MSGYSYNRADYETIPKIQEAFEEHASRHDWGRDTNRYPANAGVGSVTYMNREVEEHWITWQAAVRHAPLAAEAKR